MIETLKQIFHRMSIVFSNQLAVLITIPYITFILGVDNYGVVAAGMILVQICWILCDWGFGYHSIEFFSKNHSSKLRNQYLLIGCHLAFCSRQHSKLLCIGYTFLNVLF